MQLTTVEIFRDLAQMLGLVLNYAAGASTVGAKPGTVQVADKSGWRYYLFALLPEILGFDLISAFGKAILWFAIFVVFAAWALYEFRAMTKDKLKEVRGEGFDHEDHLTAVETKKKAKTKWRHSRAYQITITFVCTTLYVPLSKVAVDALVWSSAFWPVERNPYLTEDFPSFPASANATLYRDPEHFCYVTNMALPDGFLNFNWAFLIIPMAVCVVATLTFWFPLRLFEAVHKCVPNVDPYTELGEKRHQKDAEYQRLLVLDRNPLSFMYSDYRREWAGFKSI
jgi:hypothetical protein